MMTPSLLHSLLCLYRCMDRHHPHAYTNTHTQLRTQPWKSGSHSVFNLFPWRHFLAESIPGTQRPRGGQTLGSKQCHTSELAPRLVTNWGSLFSSFLAPNALRTLSWAKDPSMENDLFERWSGSFQSRFSSHSVSQRCVYIWRPARAPIQECELAKDIIKEMSVLICGLTFKSLGSLKAVFFWLLLQQQSISYNMTWLDNQEIFFLWLN